MNTATAPLQKPRSTWQPLPGPGAGPRTDHAPQPTAGEVYAKRLSRGLRWGPILVVYPDGTWYHHVDEALLERIITEHLLADQPVEAHIFHRLGAEGSSRLRPTRTSMRRTTAADDTEPAPAGTQLLDPEAIARRLAARAAHAEGAAHRLHRPGQGEDHGRVRRAARAWGREMRVGGVQFFKHANAHFGELRALAKMQVELTPMGDGFTWTSRDLDITQAKALHGWELAKQRIASGAFDLFVLDEFTYLLHFGWPPRCSRGSRPISRPCCTCSSRAGTRPQR